MRQRLRFFGALWLALIGASSAMAAELKVAVASNFATTAEALVEEFARHSDHKLTLLVGSSGKHTAQIQYGLAVDVFMAADADRPKLLERKGVALTGSRKTYAQGRLAVWSAASGFFEFSAGATNASPQTSTPASRTESSEISAERLYEILASSDHPIVSIANPKIAPYGLAAEQVLDSLAIKPKVVYGESVAQAFQFVSSGGAQLGLLALAQVKNINLGSYRIIPDALHAPIVQQLVRMNDSEAAKQWQDFVLGEASQGLIESRGYHRASYRPLKPEAD